MSQTQDDPRITAYVFGDLPSDQMAAFEQELEGSSELKQEVAAIRDAVAAIRSEFESQAAGITQTQRRVVEDAIRQRAQHLAPPVTPASAQAHDHSGKRNAIVALLAASVLLAVGLSFPYWNLQSGTEVSMTLPPVEMTTSDAMPAPASQPSDGMPLAIVAEASLEMEAIDRSETDNASLARDPIAADAFGTSSLEAHPFESFEKQRSDESAASGARAAAARPMSPQGPASPAGASDANASTFAFGGAAADGLSEPMNRSQLSLQSAAADTAFRRNAVANGPQGNTSLAIPAATAAPMIDAFGVDPAISQDAFRGMAPSVNRRAERGAMPALAEKEPRSGGEQKLRELADDGLSREVMDLDMSMGMGAAGDRHAPITDNPFLEAGQTPLSTFSIDVDTASYAKIRSLLQGNILPDPNAVRIEELLNYFDYDYPAPQDGHPFAASTEIVQCPWNSEHRLARIGIQAREIETQRPFSNLVFLLDVSGSMNEPDKLPLVVEGMKLLTDQLTENDKVAIVVYAGAAGIVLDSTRGDKKEEIMSALDRLRAGGSTNGGQGIALAYQIARDQFIKGGTNRVILCSDGDFNVGVTGTEDLIKLVKENAGSSIFLSVLGFGTGNHNDAMMEQLSNDGNGNYAFIDSNREAKKVFVEELAGTLVTVAKDVKIQIEFNPKRVRSYRLIGYEDRMLAAEDFADDKKDAGEIGAGHTVTALYELVPASEEPMELVADTLGLRYQSMGQLTPKAQSDEAMLLSLRYKQPEEENSSLMEAPVVDGGKSFLQSDRDFRFAAAVAGFGMLLRNSPHRGNLTFEEVHAIAADSAKGDDFGYRTEFVELVKKARQLRGE